MVDFAGFSWQFARVKILIYTVLVLWSGPIWASSQECHNVLDGIQMEKNGFDLQVYTHHISKFLREERSLEHFLSKTEPGNFLVFEELLAFLDTALLQVYPEAPPFSFRKLLN